MHSGYPKQYLPEGHEILKGFSQVKFVSYRDTVITPTKPPYKL